MTLRSFNIGTRLGAGFALILLAACLLLGFLLWSSAKTRMDMQSTYQKATGRGELASGMERTLLRSAVAVRNMGLSSELETLQKYEADAKEQRARYLEFKQQLDALTLTANERAALESLGKADAQMAALFKEAVDLGATFNTEQATAIITNKIEPLFLVALADLQKFTELQKQAAVLAAVTAEQQSTRNQTISMGLGLLVLLGSAFFGWRLTISITRPMANAEQAITGVAEGDLSKAIAAQGNDEATRLLVALERMRENLANVVSSVRNNSESVALASTEIAQGNNDLSGRTEQQASALEQTSASMEQLNEAVRQNADHAQQANRLAGGATKVASQGGEIVTRVVNNMKGINASSRKISDIIGVIDGIAFQTNILALNAAVEAARAGEQGRGFAVVANEVRNLAQRSTAAAKEIKTLIADSVERVEQGSLLVDQAGSTMLEIVDATQRVTQIMGEITLASSEQSAGVAQVSQAVTQMDQATQQNAALVEESAAAAEGLRAQAKQLVQAVAVFKLAHGSSVN
jgi:methyl-accepting chemotaxis protein